MSIAAATRLGPYEIIAPVGAGGMGEVYRARDTRLGRDVAVKVLPSSYADNKERLQRFEQEACAAGALNHPNILSIYDVGTHDGSPYVVSELLEGQTLRERLNGSVLPSRKAIDYARQIAHGLAAAHEKGILHRDLKPENLFLTKDERVKILDFGLAKLTGAADAQAQTEIPTRRIDTDPGVVMGTVGYMSPEQLQGKAVDHRSDIFSFGAIFYEMLSNRRAFHGGSAAETMSAILKEDPPDLSETNKNVAPALERVVHHCLEKNREARFHSASDLAFALEALSGATRLKAVQSFSIIGIRRWKNFNCDIPPQPRVACSIDFAHSTRANGCDDLVWSQACAGSDGHSWVFRASRGKYWRDRPAHSIRVRAIALDIQKSLSGVIVWSDGSSRGAGH